MNLATHIPGMRPGRTGRNVIVGIVYFLVLPLALFALPVYVLYAVGTDRHGVGAKLAASPLGRLPGLGTAGWKAGGAAFLYLFVVLIVVGAAVPGGGGTASPGEESNKISDTTTAKQATLTSTATLEPETQLESLARDGVDSGGFSDGIREIEVLKGDAGYVVTVRYNLSSVGNAEDDEFDANAMAIEIQSRLYQSEYDIQDVAVFAYVTVQDQYGNREGAVVSKVQIGSETAEKINWENILPRNIPQVADDYVFQSDFY